MKRRICSLILCVVMCITTVGTVNVMAREGSGYAWPGRPGGNGDGSEEWLQGEYGEMNGPWIANTETLHGYVKDLNDRNNAVEILGGIIFGAIAGYYTESFNTVATAVGDGAISAMIDSGYEGKVYDMNLYISGRRMKVVTKTYWDDKRTDPCATYTHYIKW